MSEKSHVSVEQKLCPVCHELHDVGVLLDRRLRDTLERNTVTGMWLCPAHMKVATEEHRTYIVEIDPAQSSMLPNGNVSDKGHVFFLPGIAAVRDRVITDVFGAEIPAGKVMFTDHEAFVRMTQLPGAQHVPDDNPTINPPKQEH